MLFNSYIFIFCFLPVTLITFYSIGRFSHHRVATSWLVAASLFFYGWWNPSYLGLILGSILFNYTIGIGLVNTKLDAHHRKLVLILGISVNLCALGYFKYANFFIDNINSLLTTSWNVDQIILPLAISFFTFQQIAYLVDAFRGETKEYNFLHYCLFVTFFPQLIAGPIVHHREMLPQFAKSCTYIFRSSNLTIGLTIFVIGLFKKVVIADQMGIYATPVFDTALLDGAGITLFEAWAGALGYTFQLYFDFSGYADMAIGISRMFGVRLPINFNSPYKSRSIIDFWRRWHITLSRFLRDYLYIALGGNRKGKTRRHVNLLLTMLLGGLWHGAGWTFVIWGGLHGIYLIINHLWIGYVKLKAINSRILILLGRLIGQGLTFLAIVIGWVFFRAETFDAAINILKGMFGMNGLAFHYSAFESFAWGARVWLGNHGVQFDKSLEYIPLAFVWFVMLAIVVFFAPNTQQIMARYRPVLESQRSYNKTLVWRPSIRYGVLVGVLFAVCILSLNKVSEFLYFQF